MSKVIKKKVVKNVTKVEEVKNLDDIKEVVPVREHNVSHDFLSTEHLNQARTFSYEQTIAEQKMQILDQQVRNIMLEIKYAQDVTLRAAKLEQERAQAAYKGESEKINSFMKTLKQIYKIEGNLQFNPASGKIIRN